MIEKSAGRDERKLNVLLTTVFEYPHTGGLSSHLTILKGALEKKGHRAEIISISNYPRWFYYLVVKAPSFILNRLVAGWGLVWSHEVRKSLIFLLIARRARRLDAINAQDVFAVNAVAKYDRMGKLPTVLTVHGYFRYELMSIGSLRENSSAERYFIQEEERALSRADRIVAVENGRRKYLVKLGVPESKISVISNFIEPSAYSKATPSRARILADWRIDDDPYLILCPCRLTRVKGVDLALRAMTGVAAEIPKAIMLFAGDGELRDELERESARLGLRNNVRFLGNVRHEKMIQLYSVADLVVIPSRTDKRAEEGISVAALEAMASGTPLITTPVGGFKELVEDGKTGCFVPEEDSEALAEGILRMAGDPEFSAILGMGELAHVRENHDASNAADSFLEVYHRAIIG